MAATTGWKAIMDAAYAGDAATVAACLAAGCPPDIRSPNAHRHTPLVRAVEWKKTAPRTAGHNGVAQVLLAAGADPHLRGGVHGWTPLAHALMGDQAGLPALLRPHGPDDLAHRAMAYELAGVRRALRRTGVDVDARDPVGRTALHYLAASGLHRAAGSAAALAIADALLGAGAAVNAEQATPREDGWVATPLWWAVGWQDHHALAARLLAAGADPQPAFFAAAFDGDHAMLDLLHAHGARLEHRVAGSTALIDVMRFKRPANVGWLLAHGADVHAADPAGRTALHHAVRAGVRPDVIARLLAHGADPERADAEGESARAAAQRLGRRWPG